ncbi:CRISPR-associated endonuclease Cas2 [Oceanisphaera profunda]|uniref:CRISPR-associated endoribonuclease Cas2 n=1 Tax=Oceanisphaera profunda TaxID=1416627 RepID=A0A1Y0D7A3_9GAMM|nr:CRISPR-associated endonuclease Cas2 [Oceanisphaera profunda]ART83442.1 CRISPR-associated endonuclease Cas2 [Oceanisphaera profunda]
MSKRHYLICYDIRQPRRLQRIHKWLTKHATALQYSVFLANLNKAELNQVRQGLQKLMEESEDDVRIFAVQAPEHAFIIGKPLRFCAAGLVFVH